MPIVEHLRELRGRVLKSLLAVVLGSILGYVFYDHIIAAALKPMQHAMATAQAKGYHVTTAIQGGVTNAFSLQLKISFLVGLVLAAPVWIYQLWRFVTPGLQRHERKYALVFVAAAVPLFLLGMAMAWTVLPGALNLLLGFTPKGVLNLQSLDQYITFMVQMTVVFGIGFLIPVFMVALNFFGVLPARVMLGGWRWIILGTLLFGAVATPTGDPINLSLITVPVLTLVFAAIGISWLHDRRKARSVDAVDYSELDDEEASPIAAPRPLDVDDEIT